MINLILSVDDDRVTQMLHKMLLEKALVCNEIVACMNGKEALAYLKTCLTENKEQPGLILLDLNMPVMGGWDFLESFESQKKFFPDTRIVILSSSVDPEDEKRAEEYSSVIGYLTKPLTKKMLLNITANQ